MPGYPRTPVFPRILETVSPLLYLIFMMRRSYGVKFDILMLYRFSTYSVALDNHRPKTFACVFRLYISAVFCNYNKTSIMTYYTY